MPTLTAATPSDIERTAPGCPSRPPWQRIESDSQATQLARHLQSPDRLLPSIVVTTLRGSRRAYIEMNEVADQVAGRADLYLLRTGSASYAFASAMPPRTEVYGGAIRFYPIGNRWLDDPYEAPLTMVRPQGIGADVLPLLLESLDASSGLRLAYSTIGDPWQAPRHSGQRADWQVHDELNDLRRQVHRWRQEAQDARKSARRGRATLARQAQPPEGSPVAFLDPERQFRWEVESAWVERIPASDKERLPLREYQIGRGFLESLTSVGGIERAKVVDVVVEIATGLVEQVAGRQLHQLRKPNGVPAARSDGSTCWRAAIQVGSPSARRIHFWRMRDRIELSRVGLHDDVRA